MKLHLFHDSTEQYLSPVLPKKNSEVLVTVRTDRRAEVFLLWTEELFDLTENRYARTRMTFRKEENGYFYYAAVLKIGEKSVKYRFAAILDGEEKRFGIDAFFSDEDPPEGKTHDFMLVPDFDTPEWAKGAVWYQIMPDSFSNGDPFNDKPTAFGISENGWGAGHWGQRDYFGGDLDGIIEKLDYLCSFGVTAISINPIWISSHQAGYGADDLTEVDPCFGGDCALIRLREETKKRGIKLCLDGVFDYAVSRSKYYNAERIYPLSGGVKEGEPYYDFFLRDKSGNVIPSIWEHPLFDFSKDDYRRFVYEGENSVVRTYLNPPYSIDAWRMDVGNIYEGSDPEHFGSSVDIMRGMREVIKSVGEDRLLITENDLPKMRTLAVNDSKWNYELGVPLRDFAAGKLTAREFVREAELSTRVLPRPVAEACFNHVTTHDTPRIMDTAEGNEDAAYAATLFELMFVGAPSIYFGDEYAARGKPYPGMGYAAPTSFASMDWEAAERGGRMTDLYRTLGREHREHSVFFAHAGHEFLKADGDCFAFMRYFGREHYLVIVNRAEETRVLTLDLSAYAKEETLFDLLSGNEAIVKNGRGTFKALPGGAVYSPERKKPLSFDGFLSDGAVKCGKNAYDLSGGRLSGEGYQWFSLSLGYADGNEVDLAVGDREFALSGGKLKAGEKVFDVTGGKTISVIRERELSLCVDGEKIADFPCDLPAWIPFALSGKGRVELKIFRREMPCSVGFGDGFFEQKCKPARGGIVLGRERLLGRVGYADYTFRADVSGEGGLLIAQGEKALEYGFRSGRLFLALSGEELVSVPFEGKVTLQFERQGARISACYFRDGKWEYLARAVHCNFSDYKIGIYADRRCVFENFMLGDGACRKDYHETCFSLSTDRYSAYLKPVCYRIGRGEFADCYGGIEHRGTGVLSCSPVLSDFNVVFTVKTLFSDKSEFAGLRFGEDSFRIRRNSVTLSVGGKRRFHAGGDGEYLLSAAFGMIFVRKDGKEILRMPRRNGPCEVSFFGKGKYRLMNVSVYETDVSTWYMASGKIAAMREGLDFSSEGRGYACVYALLPLKDFCFSANVKFNVSAAAFPDGYFSINYAADAGGYPEDKGISVRFYKDGERIEVMKGGASLFAGGIDTLDNESFYLVIERIGGRLRIFVAPNERERECRLVADLDTGEREGGCLIFTDKDVRTFLCSAEVVAISDGSETEGALKRVRLAPSKHRYML